MGRGMLGVTGPMGQWANEANEGMDEHFEITDSLSIIGVSVQCVSDQISHA